MPLELTQSDFNHYFPVTPTALCIKECARLVALREYQLASPLLDVGCGDGVFAHICFDDQHVTGIDINADEIALARRSNAYDEVILGDITTHQFSVKSFHSCLANCSLEHVPRLDKALSQIKSSLVPGGMFYTFVPDKKWTHALRSHRFLKAIGAHSAAKVLQEAIDNFFVHHHLYDEEGWRKVVAAAGFEVIEVKPVLSAATTSTFELFLLPSLIGLVCKKLTKHWTLFPAFRKKFSPMVYAIARRALDAGGSNPTAEFLVVARRPEELL